MVYRPAIDFNDDEVAEWLRRWTANPMGSARVGSNPILVVCFFFVFFLFDVSLHAQTFKCIARNLSYCMSKKSWPMLYSKLPYKMFYYVKNHSDCLCFFR